MDISGSFSESGTQASNITTPFEVGGGVKIPAAVWYLAAALAVWWAWNEFFS